MNNEPQDYFSFFSQLFNPEVEKQPECIVSGNDVRIRLTEEAISNSFALLQDKNIKVYQIDKHFEQLPIFNPSRQHGFRCKHDYLLIHQAEDTLEVYFVEMKSGKDTFDHIRHQLQGGIALFAYIQRLSMDRLGLKWPLGVIKFYAVALFHTKRFPETTGLNRIAEIKKERESEVKRYKDVKGVYCVRNNNIDLMEMRRCCAEVSYCLCLPNAFTNYPKEVAD
jgi:hypothetical protein